MKPCITTWPASVPTDDDERPDASSAMPKTMSAWSPTIGAEPVVDVLEVVRRRSGRARGRRAAAMISMPC